MEEEGGGKGSRKRRGEGLKREGRGRRGRERGEGGEGREGGEGGGREGQRGRNTKGRWKGSGERKRPATRFRGSCHCH